MDIKKELASTLKTIVKLYGVDLLTEHLKVKALVADHMTGDKKMLRRIDLFYESNIPNIIADKQLAPELAYQKAVSRYHDYSDVSISVTQEVVAAFFDALGIKVNIEAITKRQSEPTIPATIENKNEQLSPKDRDAEAREKLAKAFIAKFESNDLSARLYIANAYLNGIGIDPNLELALRGFKEIADGPECEYTGEACKGVIECYNRDGRLSTNERVRYSLPYFQKRNDFEQKHIATLQAEKERLQSEKARLIKVISEHQKQMSPSPSQTKPSVTKYGPATYKVGVDMPAGEYKIMPQGGSAYISICSDANCRNIIRNHNSKGQMYMKVFDGQFVQIKHSYAIPISSATTFVPTQGEYPPGEYKVGIEISPGEYKLTANTNMQGYFSIEIDVDNGKRKIIANNCFDNSAYVSIENGQILFLDKCILRV